jgi:hypothetical protein
LRLRAFTAFHADGTVTRIMQSQKQCTPRVQATIRIAIDGDTPEQAQRLTVGELEAIAQALRELAAGYDALSSDRATGQSGPARKKSDR